MEPNTLYYLLAVVLIVVGIAGTILPALPGLPLVFGGRFLAVLAGDFQQGGIVLIVGAKPVDHQLGQGHGRRWRPVFPTGEGFRVTGCPVKAVEVHLIRIKAGDGVLFQ